MGVYENLESYFNDIDITESMKKEFCQYYRGGDQYCDATSHKTCRRCGFFCPTIHGKMEIIARAYKQIKDRNAVLRKKETEQDKVIKWLRQLLNAPKENGHDAELQESE